MKAGDVVLVRFPFADAATTKKRPALLLSQVARGRRYRLATVAMITSQVDALQLDGDVRLAGWEKAGLLHPSLLRLAKVATVDGELVDKVIGRLMAEDLRAVGAAFRRLFASWLGD
ncbi:MAG: type II toxin-antitoxin system PemK/MazF family toxin [Thermodesulfobacteriota bacterium]